VTMAAATGVLAEPGITAFLVVFGMAVILFFVFRSMARHLRKINQAARDEAEAAARAEARDQADDAS
jgi:phosphotransferase system  glucose/maltose/N-acetylglucosamine-specific IIC component